MPRTDANFLSKAGPLVAARMAAAILTLSIPLVLARTLATSEYGTYKQLFLIWQTLLYVLPLGMAQSLYYFVPRAEDPRPYFVNALTFMVFMGMVGGLAIYALGPSISRFASNPELLRLRGILAIYTFVSVSAFPLEIGLTSQGKTRLSAVAYLLTDATRALLMTLPVLFGYHLMTVMIGLTGFTLVRWAACWLVLLRSGLWPPMRWGHLR
jgi:hypothetical protein